MQLHLVLQEARDHLQAVKTFVQTLVSNHENPEFTVPSADVDDEMNRLRENMTKMNNNFTVLFENMDKVSPLHSVGLLFRTVLIIRVDHTQRWSDKSSRGIKSQRLEAMAG